MLMALTFSVALIPSAYFALMQLQEDELVDHYISILGLRGLPLSKETALRVSDQVRKDFNTDEKTFTALKMAERPFLREDTAFLLTHKEGLCGEGTRVIVNLLLRLGFDASRITLFNKELQSAHTLISIVIGEREFLVDSINTSAQVTELLRANDISSSDFNVLHYSDQIATRRAFTGNDPNKFETKLFTPFFDKYWLYSYEAIPYSKILTRIGLDVRVFNFGRPNRWISALAEKPNAMMSILAFMAALAIVASKFAVFSMYKSWIKKRNRR